jgi:hypothetical protein
VQAGKTELDAYATIAILGCLARPDVHAALTAADPRGPGRTWQRSAAAWPSPGPS